MEREASKREGGWGRFGEELEVLWKGKSLAVSQLVLVFLACDGAIHSSLPRFGRRPHDH